MANDDITPAIPVALLAWLEALKDVLSANGAVLSRKESKRRASWRLRFRERTAEGQCCHRAIALEDPAVAEAVRALIGCWQEQQRQQRQQARQARKTQEEALRSERQQSRCRRRLIQLLAGGGRKRRRRIGRLYDQAAARGPEAELAFCRNERYRQPNRRPGRLPAGGLVLLG